MRFFVNVYFFLLLFLEKQIRFYGVYRIYIAYGKCSKHSEFFNLLHSSVWFSSCTLYVQNEIVSRLTEEKQKC